MLSLFFKMHLMVVALVLVLATRNYIDNNGLPNSIKQLLGLESSRSINNNIKATLDK